LEVPYSFYLTKQFHNSIETRCNALDRSIVPRISVVVLFATVKNTFVALLFPLQKIILNCEKFFYVSNLLAYNTNNIILISFTDIRDYINIGNNFSLCTCIIIKLQIRLNIFYNLEDQYIIFYKDRTAFKRKKRFDEFLFERFIKIFYRYSCTWNTYFDWKERVRVESWI